MTLPKDRIAYSAIVDRPALKLPNDARIAVWTIVNVEEWSIERAMPRTVLSPPQGQPLLPDLPNWAWHEYGMRVGFWRLVEVLEKFNVKATLAINGWSTRWPERSILVRSWKSVRTSAALPSCLLSRWPTTLS